MASRSPSARTSIPDQQATSDLSMRYPGSKAAAGVAERIIRQMPPHQVYIEACAGKAAVFRKKARAPSSVLIDIDAKLCHHLRSYLASRGELAGVEIIHGDAMELAPALAAVKDPRTLIYFDPPYLGEVRTKKVLYDFDFTCAEAHSSFLAMAAALPCMVMISGYRSELYDKKLKRWRRVDIPAMTHGGPRIESVWCNFPEPRTLHDPRYAGDGFRARERIKRKQKRWAIKFADMDPRERQAIAAALVAVDRPTVEAAMVDRRPPTAEPARLEPTPNGTNGDGRRRAAGS